MDSRGTSGGRRHGHHKPPGPGPLLPRKEAEGRLRDGERRRRARRRCCHHGPPTPVPILLGEEASGRETTDQREATTVRGTPPSPQRGKYYFTLSTSLVAIRLTHLYSFLSFAVEKSPTLRSSEISTAPFVGTWILGKVIWILHRHGLGRASVCPMLPWLE